MNLEGIRLGINIDHIATLREVRKAAYPNLLEAAFECENGGADQITIHLREDRRHIQDYDLEDLLKHSRLPINLEMAFIPEMVEKGIHHQPYSVTLVPERRAEMTTESGLDLSTIVNQKKLLRDLKNVVRVYAFIDPDSSQVQLAKDLGFEGVEFHTGTFAHSFDKSCRTKSSSEFKAEITRLHVAAAEASKIGLEVKAGHGLTLQNIRFLLSLPGISEVNIGHSIVSRAVFIGLAAAVSEMKKALLL